jgi:hypothetical protein
MGKSNGMISQRATPLETLASVTGTVEADWETLSGPDSGVGVDFWYRHTPTGREAYLNLDQDHLTISVDGEKVFEGSVEAPETTGD